MEESLGNQRDEGGRVRLWAVCTTCAGIKTLAGAGGGPGICDFKPLCIFFFLSPVHVHPRPALKPFPVFSPGHSVHILSDSPFSQSFSHIIITNAS